MMFIEEIDIFDLIWYQGCSYMRDRYSEVQLFIKKLNFLKKWKLSKYCKDIIYELKQI